MYIVVQGTVGIFLSLPPANGQAEWASHNKLLAQFSPESKSPWFGEAVLNAYAINPTTAASGAEPPLAKRGAGAFTLQTTQLLSMHISKAERFIQMVPEFVQMNKAYQDAYKKTNEINHGKSK